MNNERLLAAMQDILDNGLDTDSFFALREAAAEYESEPPAPRIIRTVEELEALEDEAIVQTKEGIRLLADELRFFDAPESCLPVVVLVPFSQVLAAREALNGESHV